jgi:hypothetical protein
VSIRMPLDLYLELPLRLTIHKGTSKQSIFHIIISLKKPPSLLECFQQMPQKPEPTRFRERAPHHGPHQATRPFLAKKSTIGKAK